LVVVVHAGDIFQNVESIRASAGARRFQIAVGGNEGTPLKEPQLPEWRVSLQSSPVEASGGSGLAQVFFALSLLFVVGLASLAGYLALRDTRRELRMADMRSQFVASVSHELKTPLTSIRMFAELLEMRTADESTQAEYLNTIVNESERLTRLLNNVLDFSRIEHGQKSYAIAPTQLDQVIRSATRVMEYPLNAQGFDLRVQIDEAMPPVPADPDAVKQAVLNLLTNAMKYSGKSRTIELQLRRDGSEAVVEVTDHGIGIPALVSAWPWWRTSFTRITEAYGSTAGTATGRYFRYGCR
jgi:signal transduction histidine kinase